MPAPESSAKAVQHGHDCIILKWCGMWLGIEPDGYVQPHEQGHWL